MKAFAMRGTVGSEFSFLFRGSRYPLATNNRMPDWVSGTSASGVGLLAVHWVTWVECSPSFNLSKSLCRGTGLRMTFSTVMVKNISIRAISRMTGTSENTVLKLLEDARQAFSDHRI